MKSAAQTSRRPARGGIDILIAWNSRPDAKLERAALGGIQRWQRRGKLTSKAMTATITKTGPYQSACPARIFFRVFTWGIYCLITSGIGHYHPAATRQLLLGRRHNGQRDWWHQITFPRKMVPVNSGNASEIHRFTSYEGSLPKLKCTVVRSKITWYHLTSSIRETSGPCPSASAQKGQHQTTISSMRSSVSSA